jgi:serine/threonine protein kinase
MPHRKSLEAGSKIRISNDEYTIDKLISRGGTSLIYEASRPYSTIDCDFDVDISNVKKVIIKEMAPYDIPFVRKDGHIHFQSDRIEILEDIFQGEIHNIAKIQRHNETLNRIPDMDAFGKYNGTLYIAMNHIKGELLSKYIHDNRLDIETVMRRFTNILYIVQELHSMDEPYLHLDLKPMNFIVGGLGTIYLFDFGSTLIMEGEMVKNFTEDYSAPEVIFNYYSRVGKASDIYSLGVILYEMITGNYPDFDKFLLSKGNYYEPKQGEPDYNPLIAKMTSEDARKRLQTIEEVFKEIEAIHAIILDSGN